ncbi:transglutaminase domain-containing protein [Lacinutrix undariae]
MKYLILINIFIFTICSNAQSSDFKSIKFKTADSIAMFYKGEDLDNLPQLAYKLTANLTTDVERFRAIYMWVCTNISNDYKSFLKNKHNRIKYQNDSLKLHTWNTNFSKTLFKTLQKRKRTVCTGYAYLIRELANLARIECEIVQGYSKTSITDIKALNSPNHSWNAVKLNKKWYLCDATWASGNSNPKTNEFEFQYNDGYFLTAANLFALNHFPTDTKWLLIANNKLTFQEFINTPIVYSGTFTELKSYDSPKKFHQEILIYQPIKFSYQLKKSILTHGVYLVIDNGDYSKKTEPSTLKQEQNKLEFSYQFTKIGFYDVHVFIKNKLIATHTFNVSNRVAALNY